MSFPNIRTENIVPKMGLTIASDKWQPVSISMFVVKAIEVLNRRSVPFIW
jgi:hypothetical protein